jgi:hypothetical protein
LLCWQPISEAPTCGFSAAEMKTFSREFERSIKCAKLIHTFKEHMTSTSNAERKPYPLEQLTTFDIGGGLGGYCCEAFHSRT